MASKPWCPKNKQSPQGGGCEDLLKKATPPASSKTKCPASGSVPILQKIPATQSPSHAPTCTSDVAFSPLVGHLKHNEPPGPSWLTKLSTNAQPRSRASPWEIRLYSSNNLSPIPQKETKCTRPPQKRFPNFSPKSINGSVPLASATSPR